MENIKLYDLQKIFETLNKSKIERKGFILLPSMEGYKLFEINEDRLKLYLEAESVYKHSESIINKQTDCPAEFIEIVDKEFWNLI